MKSPAASDARNHWEAALRMEGLLIGGDRKDTTGKVVRSLNHERKLNYETGRSG